ncbi:MAG TPA: FAD/NAD(P)-binding protein [Acidimicrobiales bacterium]
MTPRLFGVVGRTVETSDVVTLALAPHGGDGIEFRHGQFNMLTAFGVGEAAISVSSAPGDEGPIEHSVRDVGPVTHALCGLPVGGTVGLRGPFGTAWGIRDDRLASGADAVIVAGGIGMAPLRGLARDLLARQHRGHGRLYVLVGARSPDQVVFAEELESWRRDGAFVDVSVDQPGPGWPGTVGVVTTLLDSAPFDAARATAFVCGPEVMMRFTARALVHRGVDAERIRISLERNMQCGLGLCGHCQLGPLLVCRDGPVVPYAGVGAELLRERQR